MSQTFTMKKNSIPHFQLLRPFRGSLLGPCEAVHTTLVVCVCAEHYHHSHHRLIVNMWFDCIRSGLSHHCPPVIHYVLHLWENLSLPTKSLPYHCISPHHGIDCFFVQILLQDSHLHLTPECHMIELQIVLSVIYDSHGRMLADAVNSSDLLWAQESWNNQVRAMSLRRHPSRKCKWWFLRVKSMLRYINFHSPPFISPTSGASSRRPESDNSGSLTLSKQCTHRCPIRWTTNTHFLHFLHLWCTPAPQRTMHRPPCDLAEWQPEP
mmetsp:Transcript_44513/g.100652  ORF Transcript_44513/g.100652 Transcript_44513/m.100652 type:complete len:266 (-) Transcript_44513:12-809(-)